MRGGGEGGDSPGRGLVPLSGHPGVGGKRRERLLWGSVDGIRGTGVRRLGRSFPRPAPPTTRLLLLLPPGDPGCHRPRPTPPPTPRVVLARIPAFLFRLTSPPRRREAGPRVDPGLFGGGRAVPCPPNPRASLSPVARPWLPRGVFGASRDGLCPPAAGSGPGFLPAVGPPCLRSTAPILPPLGPGPLSLPSAAAAALLCGGGGGRPAAEWLPRHGPSVPRKTRVPRAGRATDGVRYPSSGPAVVGGAWVRRFPPLPAPPRPPPSLQVPSASRRGGLKTPRGGRPSALGSGRSGRWGGGVPSPPGSASPHGAGPPCLVAVQPLSPWPSGGGLIRWPSPASRSVAVCERARVCPVPVLGGWEPPGACGVVRAPPTHPCVCVWAPDAPSCEAFRPTGLLCFPLTRPARGDPPAPHALHPAAPRGRVGRGEEEGGQCAVPPFQTKHVRLLAVDHSARASMKNAASCEN